MPETTDPRETPLHPRHPRPLRGHAVAERALLQAFSSGKLHHAWLIAGARGVGKATLAYRFARFLLSRSGGAGGFFGEDSLDVNPQAPAAQLITARSHPDLLVVERSLDREGKRLKAQISAEDARAATEFFALTPAMGGHRICIVDAADDLNPTAANALLKILEEPPRSALFLLIAHSPGRLLPTIRSRAIALSLSPLATDEVAEVVERLAPGTGPEEIRHAAALSGGSPGRALDLLGSSGARLFLEARPLFGSARSASRKALFEIAGAMQRREAAEDYQVFAGLMLDWLAAQGREAAVAGAGGEASAWARLSQEIGHSIREANVLNLDRRQLLIDAFDMMEQAQARKS
ncbi:MAG: DNA polymerase III subunit delta' [Parvibaculaceae bacterium]